ncbi:MAG: hypothetical protein QOK19_1138 [Solirubrobacteraceae bacterium]|nr:hypothetical protein [Solirubrobacteraceae bacterium]
MDGKPGPSEERDETGLEAAPVASRERSSDPARPERYGPLDVTRMRKEDGRALIVYSRTERTERTESAESADVPREHQRPGPG